MGFLLAGMAFGPCPALGWALVIAIALVRTTVGHLICGVSAGGDDKELHIECGAGELIDEVVFASYGGTHLPGFNARAPCHEPRQVHPQCHAKESKAVVAKHCVGWSSCTLGRWGDLFSDPCWGKIKSLHVVARCAPPKRCASGSAKCSTMHWHRESGKEPPDAAASDALFTELVGPVAPPSRPVCLPKAHPRDVQRAARGDISAERFLAHWSSSSASAGGRAARSSDPVLGFVVPAYEETADSIVTTVRSLLAQDMREAPHFPATIIVAVDGYDTATAEAAVAKVRAEGTAPPNFTVVVLAGAWRGLAGTRNHAIHALAASVEWVMPVDSGDTIDSGFLASAATALRRDQSLNYVMPLLCIKSSGYMWGPGPVQDSATKLHEKNLLHCCAMYRRELFAAVGGYEPAMSFGWEDWDFWTRANQTVPGGLRGFVVGKAKQKCTYAYRADGMHEWCESSREQHERCMAAFVIASGGIYDVARVAAAHDTILAAPDFAEHICGAHKMSGGAFRSLSPLRALFCGLMHEGAHREEDALLEYTSARRLNEDGVAPTRGIEWQASRLVTRMLQRAKNMPGLARWCKKTTAIHPSERGAAALADNRWQASGCAFANLVPARVRAPRVDCDERFGTLTHDGLCVCRPGYGGNGCSQHMRALPGLKPRVCMITLEFGTMRLGGIGSAFTQLATFLASQGFPVQVIVAPWYGDRISQEHVFQEDRAFFRRQGIFIESIKGNDRLKTPNRYHLELAYMVYQWARRHESECDIIHYHEYFGVGFFLARAKKEGIAFGSVTLIAQLHGMWSWAISNQKTLRDVFAVSVTTAERRSVEDADIVVSCSQYMLDHVRSFYGAQIDPRRAYVFQNVLHNDQNMAVIGEQRAVDIRELVFFGKTDLFKGIDVFCDAVDDMLQNGRAPPAVTFLVRLKLVTRNGEGGADYIARRTRAWKMSGVEVRLETGHGSEGCVRYLKGGGRLAVMPSRLENSPTVVLEAIGNRIPFVATAVGGTPELIDARDRAHALVPCEVRALSERLSHVLSNGQQPCRLAVSLKSTQQKWLDLHISGISLRPAALGSRRTCTAGGRNPPLVSIVVPTFNRAGLLPGTIATLWAQTYPAIEIVIVNDASTDANVSSTLRQLHANYTARATGSAAGDGAYRNLVIVHNKVNMYLGASRNRGASEANGSLLLFADDDDPVFPSAVENMVSALCRRGLDVVGARPFYVPRDATLPRSAAEVASDERSIDFLVSGSSGAEALLYNAYGGPFAMFRKVSFDSLGGFTTLRAGCEDYEMWSRCAQGGLAIDALTEPQFVYREGGGGMERGMNVVDCLQRVSRWARGALPFPFKDLPELGQQLYVEQGGDGRIERGGGKEREEEERRKGEREGKGRGWKGTEEGEAKSMGEGGGEEVEEEEREAEEKGD